MSVHVAAESRRRGATSSCSSTSPSPRRSDATKRRRRRATSSPAGCGRRDLAAVGHDRRRPRLPHGHRVHHRPQSARRGHRQPAHVRLHRSAADRRQPRPGDVPPDDYDLARRRQRRSTTSRADIARVEKTLNDQYNRTRVERQLQPSLRPRPHVARAARPQAGHLFHRGVRSAARAGRDARATADEQDDVLQTMSGNVWRVDTDARYGSSMTMTHPRRDGARVPRLRRRAARRRHPGRARAERLRTARASTPTTRCFLSRDPTGGEVFKNSNDINADLEQMLRAQEVVYVLGFRAPVVERRQVPRAEGARERRAAARACSTAPATTTPARRARSSARSSNAEIVLNDIPQNDIDVAALAAAFPAKDGKRRCRSCIDIGGRGLLHDAKANDVVAEVYMYAFDDEGVVRDRIVPAPDASTSRGVGRLRAAASSTSRRSAFRPASTR